MTSGSLPRLDVVIPVYNEGANILQTLGSLLRTVRTPHRVLICYDRDDDDTLIAIDENRQSLAEMNIEFVRNRGRGAHSAVLTGFATSTAPLVLVLTADDDYNASIIDGMVAKALAGFDLVCPSRFAPGGTMTGCPFVKACVTVVGNLSLYYLTHLPARDATNGFRLFSRRVLDQIAIESDRGFCYSIELLVKCHRLRWPIAEVAAAWQERVRGASRFRVLQWLPAYARWYFYALATTYLRRPACTVRLKQATQP